MARTDDWRDRDTSRGIWRRKPLRISDHKRSVHPPETMSATTNTELRLNNDASLSMGGQLGWPTGTCPKRNDCIGPDPHPEHSARFLAEPKRAKLDDSDASREDRLEADLPEVNLPPRCRLRGGAGEPMNK